MKRKIKKTFESSQLCAVILLPNVLLIYGMRRQFFPPWHLPLSCVPPLVNSILHLYIPGSTRVRAWLLSFGTILFFFSLCCVTVIKSWPNKPTNPQTKQHTEDINFKFNFLFDEKCKFNNYKECQNWNKTRTVFTFTIGPLSKYDIPND